LPITRYTEMATCKGCGELFDRSTKNKRKNVYCSLPCQYETRSADYKARGIAPPAPKRAVG